MATEPKRFSQEVRKAVKVFEGSTEDLQSDYAKDSVMAEFADVLMQGVQRGSDIVGKLRASAKKS